MLKRGFAQVHEHDLRAFLDVQFCGDQTEGAGATGDQGNLVSEPWHGVVSYGQADFSKNFFIGRLTTQ